MDILALDPATKCGFEHSSGFGGVWDLSVKQDESSGMRFMRLYAHLTEIHEDHGIDLLLFESARNKQHARTVVILARIQGTIELWATQNGVEYQPVSPMTIKAFADDAKFTKEKMIKEAKKHTGRRKIQSSDHADAILLLQWGLKKYAGATKPVFTGGLPEA